jgi:hypothetical protein
MLWKLGTNGWAVVNNASVNFAYRLLNLYLKRIFASRVDSAKGILLTDYFLYQTVFDIWDAVPYRDTHLCVNLRD